MNNCIFHDLMAQPYGETLEIQRQLFNQLIAEASNNQFKNHHLIAVEHNHVYTFGKHADRNNLLINPAYLKQLGAESFEIERGGDITYHGPGQLVFYPIFNLSALGIGIKRFVQNIELAIIKTLEEYNIIAGVIPDRIGVWLDIGTPEERKIAAIGIKCSRYISMHGLALNVNTDLTMFNHIVPCGIIDKGVTSMEKELNEKISLFEVNEKLKNHFKSIFELNFI